MHTVPLSILDLAPISAGSDAATALRNTVVLAQRAEQLGYHRFWIAEHHIVAVASGPRSSSPWPANPGIAGKPTSWWPTSRPGLRRSGPNPDRRTLGSTVRSAGFATLPAGPRGHPVLLQAGDSTEGRALGARHADTCSLWTLRCRTVSATTPTSRGGLSPTVETRTSSRFSSGDVRHRRHPRRGGGRDATQSAIRRSASARGGYVIPIRSRWPVAIANGPRRRTPPQAGGTPSRSASWLSPSPVASSSSGSASQIAKEIDQYVQADACDGFISVPHLTPHGLDEFVDRVVPLCRSAVRSVLSTAVRHCASIWG
jgi:alkanesulfonate monooxygenase SsuD/methylene tetrahydromethanopterin reductase-like flavin-dependent oxidoreductase (luciferase family)